jgi:hypothetical protein
MVALVNIKNVHGALLCYIGSRIRCIPDPKGVKNYCGLNAKLINQPASSWNTLPWEMKGNGLSHI